MHKYRSPILTFAHAAELPGVNDSLIDAAGVPWHFGNPLREQRLIEREGVVVDRSHRRVIKVVGPDAAGFLNNLLSQKLDDAADGFHSSALDLDAQGRILHHADVTVSDGAQGEPTFFLDVPSYSLESFRDFLTKMVFWSQVTVEEADLGLLTVLGAPSDFDPGAVLGVAADAVTPAFVRTVDWDGPRRIDLAVPRADLAQAYRTLTTGDTGLGRAGLMAFTAERVKALEPELRVDLDSKSIPHEVHTLIGRNGRLGAVHLDKGCYRGQETVARVENLGRSPRLLVLLHLDGSSPVEPEPGAPIENAGRTVGRLGSVVHDCDFGPIGLGLIKRSALPGTGGDHAAAVQAPQFDVIAGVSSDAAAGSAPETSLAVTASVDTDSLPADEGERAGRAAVDKLRGR